MSSSAAFLPTLPGVSSDDAAGALPVFPAELVRRYAIEAHLGGGGMGLVYRARHRASGRPVALKLLRSALAANPTVIERLRREAKSAATIRSPHVVEVLEFDQLPDGTAYLAMELLEGRDLADELARGAFSVARTLRVAAQICEALGAAHRAHVVHRDLKPENVFLVERGDHAEHVKVLDFGLAKVRGMASITVAGTALGTPESMAPEQCSGDPADARTDVYAFGVLLYRLLLRRGPFVGSLPALMIAHLMEPPVAPSAHRADIPPALDALILKCLSKSPGDRFQSMDEVAAALAKVSTLPDESGVRSVVDAVTPKARRRGVGVAAILVSAIVIGLAGGITAALAMRPASAPELEPVAIEPVAIEPVAIEPVEVERVEVERVEVERVEVERVEVERVEVEPVEVEPVVVRPPVTPEPSVSTPAEMSPTFTLRSEPSGATVELDGERVGTTPIALPRPRGGARAVVRLRHEGHHSREIQLGSSVAAEVVITLPARAAPAPTPVIRPLVSPMPRPLAPRGRGHSSIVDPW